MKVFSTDHLNERQHRNIHESYDDLCQRLFNTIEPDSCIPPERHASDPKDELLIAAVNPMAFVTGVVRFGADRNGDGLSVGAEAPANIWHTVIALESGCVLLDVKAGPFDPSQPKNLAPWAPDECGPNTKQYLEKLISRII